MGLGKRALRLRSKVQLPDVPIALGFRLSFSGSTWMPIHGL